MKQRMKASDVYAQTNNPFVPKTNFEGAFPDIENIIVRVNETDDYGHESVRNYGKGDHGQYINCSNERCYNGGFPIGDAISRMYFRQETEGEGQYSCQGYEGSPKGRRRGDACEHRFRYTISITYKSKEKTEAPSQD